LLFVNRQAFAHGLLAIIVADLGAVIAREQPTEVAVEKVFVNVNPQSTLLLGQARGAAIAAAAPAARSRRLMSMFPR